MASPDNGAVPTFTAAALGDGAQLAGAVAGPAAAAASRTRAGVGTAILVTLVGLLSIAFIFRYQILSRFTLLNGNRGDQVITDSIYEHWFSVFRGMARWQTVGYDYPFTGSLGYNDGYFLYGVIYSFFRTTQLDPYLSGECVSIVIRLIGFLGFYAAARRVLDLRPSWAVLCAVPFLSVYLPKAHETGMHPYRAAQIHTLTLPDLMDVGHGNSCMGGSPSS